MKVFVAPPAAATIRGLPPQAKRRLKTAILRLADDPVGVRRALDVKRLRTHREEPPYYRVRVGDWRIVYRILENRIEVVRVFPRSEGYGWMERLGY